MSELKEVQWTKDDMVEVNLKEPDDFLKVRETLTRIGVCLLYTSPSPRD